MDEVRAKQAKLDLASEVKRVEEVADVLRDIEVIDAEVIDGKDRRNEAT